MAGGAAVLQEESRLAGDNPSRHSARADDPGRPVHHGPPLRSVLPGARASASRFDGGGQRLSRAGARGPSQDRACSPRVRRPRRGWHRGRRSITCAEPFRSIFARDDIGNLPAPGSQAGNSGGHRGLSSISRSYGLSDPTSNLIPALPLQLKSFSVRGREPCPFVVSAIEPLQPFQSRFFCSPHRRRAPRAMIRPARSISIPLHLRSRIMLSTRWTTRRFRPARRRARRGCPRRRRCMAFTRPQAPGS